MIARTKWTLGAALLLVLAAAGCDRSPMDADRAMMRRWAEEMDQDASQMREQIGTMRQLAPEQWHARMDEHAGLVTGMLDRMDRRMDEMRQMGGMRMGGMGMGMAMGDVGRMMGMGAEGHQEMVGLMETLRDDVHELRIAAPAEVMERMPGHLERLEQMAQMMEQGAAHMRAMASTSGMH
jgi:hypothetical protein